jgi:selenocysteine lyase/cysteine desulfurase
MSEIKKLAKKKNFCSDSYDMVNRMPLGSIRASLGYLTTYEDVVAFVEFIKKYFVE